jgi:hypothetical protein
MPQVRRAALHLTEVGETRSGERVRYTSRTIQPARTDSRGRFSFAMTTPRQPGTYVVVARYGGDGGSVVPDSNCDLRFQVR